MDVWTWAVRERGTRLFAGIVLALLLVPACVLYANIGFDFAGADASFNDFFGIWSATRLAAAGHAAGVYDLATLTGFRQSLAGAFDASQPYAGMPYCYPPLFLVLLWPLGLFPYWTAYAAWMVATFSVYCAAVPGWTGGRRLVMAAMLLLAPATVYTISYGQNGFLSAALLTAGLRLAKPRPLLAGVLFGLMAYKPQLAVLVPIALASAGLWRAFASAAVTAAVLLAGSVLVLGWPVWQVWLASMAALPEDIRLHWQYVYHLMPTTMVDLLMLGVPWPVARAVQFAVSAAVAITIWFAFRKGVTGLAVAALLAGAVLASPYAFIYDLPLVTMAMLLVIRERDGAAFALPELLIMTAVLVLPYVMVSQLFPVPLDAPVLGALFCMIVRRLLPRSRPRLSVAWMKRSEIGGMPH